jgi:hypothetical protein
MAYPRVQTQFADLSNLGLPRHGRNLEAASKALELAAQQIDKLIDPSIPDEERKTAAVAVVVMT